MNELSLLSHLILSSTVIPVRYNKKIQIQNYNAKAYVCIPVSYDVTFDIIQMKWKHKFTTKGIGTNM